MRGGSSGIYSQMKWEKRAAKKLGLTWDVKIFVPNDSIYHNDDEIIEKSKKNSDEYSNIGFRKEYYEWLLSQKENYDCFILRYNNFDLQQFMFIKKVNKPVYLVHHTLELPELRSGKTIKSKIQFIIESIIGKYSIRNAKGIITVTNEIFKYENDRVNNTLKNKFIYPNGILYESNVEVFDERKDIPEIVFVASYFYDWHGLDLLLQDLKNSQDIFKLHIIGDISENDRALINCDNRVVLHGHLNEEQIQEVLKSAWVGLASFALYRKQMYEACTLKVREYLKNGLPVYSGHQDVFDEDFVNYKIGEPKFKNILDYCYEMRVLPKNMVSSQSKIYISKEELLDNLYMYLNEEF